VLTLCMKYCAKNDGGKEKRDGWYESLEHVSADVELLEQLDVSGDSESGMN
jgi:hypothetical protein